MRYGLNSPVFMIITTTDGHALRYCVPMDYHRPGLDLKFYDKICPDPNGASLQTWGLYLTHHFEVPVIAVFTKYDQFLRNVKMDVSDYPDRYPDSNGNQVAEDVFQDHYLRPLGDNARYVRLESESRVRCQAHTLMHFGRNAHER